MLILSTRAMTGSACTGGGLTVAAAGTGAAGVGFDDPRIGGDEGCAARAIGLTSRCPSARSPSVPHPATHIPAIKMTSFLSNSSPQTIGQYGNARRECQAE